MLEKIKYKIEEYKKVNDVHQYQLILDASTIFIKSYSNGVSNESELNLGVELLRNLISVTMVTSLHQYEYNYELQNEILYKKIAVFRLCIPSSHGILRGFTETFVGMKENEMNEIILTL
ncbi:hypothetical protein SL054_002497 [Flavobacterium psychrophilum]|uniref:hypothetical protein n=1 Tax=Flavobacterium psychrophilum TaxID=96345 RepID=UPI00106A7AB0|nr:hypothetical protein [Flavobacterium psychrophilum]ELY1993127.1 hypothetical protein [Flavobacterium psychrophilum]